MNLAALHDPALRERTAAHHLLPVDEVFAPVLPGLQPGRIVGCGGPAAVSLGLAVSSRAVGAGSWLAVVGMPMLGVEAAAELGVPLTRLVRVDVDGGPTTWAERVTAAADGFDLILTRAPAGAERVVRKVRQRLQARGAVLVVVAPASHRVSCDVELTTEAVEWAGIGSGSGHLRVRRAIVRVGGRRVPRPATLDMWLPGPGGRIAPACDTSGDVLDDASVDSDEWSQAG